MLVLVLAETFHKTYERKKESIETRYILVQQVHSLETRDPKYIVVKNKKLYTHTRYTFHKIFSI